MKRFAFLFFAVALALQACNLPSNAPATDLPGAPSALPVEATARPQAEESTATLAATETPASTATPQNPKVIRDTLCWVGPGNKYEVVSALKLETRITLIGRGTVDGWWVISNPIYKDPCWVQANDVQIEPGFDTSTLKLINPPPLPTPTWTPSKTPTPTP